MANHSPSLDQVFQALADPTRRAVIQRLADGPAGVSELARPFQMALPSFVQHIKVLESCGLVRSEKVGRVRTCYVVPQTLSEAERWLAERRALWQQRLDALADFVEQKRRNP